MKKKWLIAALALLTVVLMGTLGRQTVYHLYREAAYLLGDPTPAEQTVHAYAKANRIPYGEYTYDIISLLETNPEAEGFVLHYPFREAANPDVRGVSRETVPLFLQWDTRWGYEIYGSSYLAVTGCGPTCLAMAGYYLTGSQDMNPLSVAKFSEENGYYAPGYGSSWTLFSEGAAALGLAVKELPLVKGKIVDALEARHPVVLALGKGDFTSAGHYIVLTGLENGAFRVNDPNSPIRSARLWTYEELEPQIRNIWELSAQ